VVDKRIAGGENRLKATCLGVAEANLVVVGDDEDGVLDGVQEVPVSVDLIFLHQDYVPSTLRCFEENVSEEQYKSQASCGRNITFLVLHSTSIF